MKDRLDSIKTAIYDRFEWVISDCQNEAESKAYKACRFDLNGVRIICRDAKITPKKVGQFVTFWKRNETGVIEPFHTTDQFDFYVVNVSKEGMLGQFVFPKTVLIKKGIISTGEKEGKRAFRVYPSWDEPNNKQAERTQKWQRDYFYEVEPNSDLKRINALFRTPNDF